MKRGLVLLFGILLVGFITASPFMFFVNPTPSNNHETTSSSFGINVSLTNVSSLKKFIFNWEGNNYSLYDEDLVLMLNLNNNSALGENDSVVVDSSRYGNNGTVLGGALATTSGKFGEGYNFTGSQSINISNFPGINQDNITVSFWVKPQNTKIIAFSSADQHACFVLQNYDTYCVGNNNYGQLGDNTTVDSVTPIKIQGYKFKDVEASQISSCGLLQNGTVLCWGRNNYGQLGIGSTTEKHTPQFVSSNYTFVSLVESDRRACGYLENGTLVCWGDGNHGEFGDGLTSNKLVPTAVLPNTNFSKIAVGGDHMCGILQNGTLLCWGGNYEAQLGRGDCNQPDINEYCSNTWAGNIPEAVSGDGLIFKDISAGEDQNCAILVNGSLMCWGENNEGQIGDGTILRRDVPTFSDTDFLFKKIFSGKHIECAQLINGSFSCWGRNFSPSSYGNGGYLDHKRPTLVGWNFDNLFVGRWNDPKTCGLINESVYCWGNSLKGSSGLGYTLAYYNIPLKLSYEDGSEKNFSQIILGYISVCLIGEDSITRCVGPNYNYELGINSTDSVVVPTPISGDYNFSSVYPGNAGSCGLLQNGTALCWGKNNISSLLAGFLGRGFDANDSLVPVPVSGDYNFTSLSTSDPNSCGLLQNGTALCWGRNDLGQLGINTTTNAAVPTPIENYTFSSIKVNALNSCGLLTNGTLVCFGRNDFGAAGDGTFTSPRTSPRVVSGNYNFSDYFVGNLFACGLLQNGTALCWGRNTFGQIGDNSTTNRNVPTPVYGDYNFSDLVTIGVLGVCGLLQNGTALCWGYGVSGVMGDRSYENNLIPSPIYGNFVFSRLYAGTSAVCGQINNSKDIYCWGNMQYLDFGTETYFPNVPKSFYLGDIISKSPDDFKIGLTSNNSLRVIYNLKSLDYDLGDGFSNVVMSLSNKNINVYINGNLVLTKNLITNTSYYNPFLDDLILGNVPGGILDEVRIYNRTLSASEVDQLYKSNLKQKNSTSWEFYSSQNLPTDKTYSYSVFALDGISSFKLVRDIIKYTLSSGSSASSTGTGTGLTYKAKASDLQDGYSKLLKATQKIQVSYPDGKTKTYEIKSVNTEGKTVTVSYGGKDYSVSLDNVVKIDSNSDGYYDTEISVKEVRINGYANVEFKLINEKVPSENKDSQNENVKDNSSGNNPVPVEKNNSWQIYVGIGLVVVLIGIWFWLRKRK